MSFQYVEIFKIVNETCFIKRTTNTGSWSACNSLQIVRSAAWVPSWAPWELFPGFPSLGQLHYSKQWWETKPVWRFLSLLVLSPVADAAAAQWVNQFSLGTQRLPDLLPCTGCSEGNSTVLQVLCMAKPAYSLATSTAGRDVLNIVFHISCADKSLLCLLPGLMRSHPGTWHTSLRRGWVSPSDRHVAGHALVGTFPWVSVNRLGWWLFQYLPPNICNFPFPWKNNIKVLKLFLLKKKTPTECTNIHIFYMKIPGSASFHLAIYS